MEILNFEWSGKYMKKIYLRSTQRQALQHGQSIGNGRCHLVHKIIEAFSCKIRVSKKLVIMWLILKQILNKIFQSNMCKKPLFKVI